MTLDCASRTMINSMVWFLGPPNRYNEAVLLMHFDGSCYLICGGSNSQQRPLVLGCFHFHAWLQGWTTFQSFLPFLTTSTLPCNIPNCTLNFNCSGSHLSPAPSPQTPAPPPASSDACIFPGICGRGQCVITNTSFLIPTFKCVCDPGYENVLNLTLGFCVNECELEGS